MIDTAAARSRHATECGDYGCVCTSITALLDEIDRLRGNIERARAERCENGCECCDIMIGEMDA